MVLSRSEAIGLLAAITSLAGCRLPSDTRPASRAAHPGTVQLSAAYRDFQASCEQGSADACVDLGRAGIQYGGLPTGVPWLVRACDLEPKACVALGDALIGRRANASDPQLAALAYRRACEAEHSGACYELAVLHYLGLGVEVDDPLAARLHHTACDRGVPEGCAYLVWLYDRGFGVEASSATSAYYREVACDRGYHDMCDGREPSEGFTAEANAEANAELDPDPEQTAPVVPEAPRTKPKREVRIAPTTASPAED